LPSSVARTFAAASLVRGDACDPTLAALALRDVRHVIWCAGGLMPAEAEQHPLECVSANLAPLLCFLEAMDDDADLVDFTYLSSGGTIYGGDHEHSIPEICVPEPRTAYGIANLTAEHFVARSCTRVGARPRVLRCGNIYGPGQPGNRSQGLIAAALTASAERSAMRVYGDGSATRDYLFVDDFVAVVAHLVGSDAPFETLNVGSGVGSAVTDVLEAVAECTTRPLELEFLPARACDARQIVLDTARLRAVVPFEPRSLLNGIERTWAKLTTEPCEVVA
jgi:UDP-glucose 4-epimerase